MAIETAITIFIEENMILIFILSGMFLGFFMLFKMIRKVPAQPDFIRIFKDQAIKDQQLNKPDEYEPHWLYRGHKLLGKIVAYDEQPYNNQTTKEEDKFGLSNWKANLTTVIFIKPLFMKFCIGSRQILRFKTEEANIENDRLVFPSDAGFTALGGEFITKKSFPEASAVIEGVYSKRLLEANVNIMASKMSHISSESPEMAHELNLKRLEIERIRAEKEKKIGQLI